MGFIGTGVNIYNLVDNLANPNLISGDLPTSTQCELINFELKFSYLAQGHYRILHTMILEGKAILFQHFLKIFA